jgi:hypothetical protein
MKRIKSKYSKDPELRECINSAYTDLHILLQGAFINISKLPNQLTIIEFTSLFENYDWNDLFNKLEELENLSDITKVESVFRDLSMLLKYDLYINPLINPRENTYFKVWAGLISDEDLD